MNIMKNIAQAGTINILLSPLVLVVLLFFAAAGFAFQESSQVQHYKNNVDQIVAQKADDARLQVSQQKDKEFAQKEKYPYATYKGPSPFGSISIQYPKTWSAYVSDQLQGSSPVTGYCYPLLVPAAELPTNSYALGVQVTQQSYNAVLQQYRGFVQQKTVTVQPYVSPNVPNVVGSRLDGAIQPQKQGAMIIMPLRDQTLQIWTESADFKPDFDNIVLPNFTFTP